MADSGETTFIFKADTKPAESSLDEFGDKVVSVGKKAGLAIAAYFTFSALKRGIEESTKAAIESEKAILAFNSALSLSGKFTESASNSFLNFASRLERTTGVQDEIILKNAALLISLGKLSGDGLERATKASLDLARGMQVDVGAAFDVLTKATQGNVMALKRYGLEVNLADSDSAKFAKTLQFVESRFGGLASGEMNTLGGVLKKLSLGFEEIQESIGKMATGSPKFIALISVIGDSLYKLSQSIAHSSKNLNGMVDSLFKIGDVITNWVLKPLEMFGNFLAVGFSTMIAGFLKILEPIAPILDRIFKTDYTESIKQLGEIWAQTTVNMAEQAAAFDVTSSETIDKAIDRTKSKVDQLAMSMGVTLPSTVAASTSAMTDSWSNFADGFSDGVKSIAGNLSSLGKAISGTFVNGMTNAVAAMGKAIVQGGNVFDAFGKQILSTLGAVAIQMGQFLVLAGMGFAALPGGFSAAAAIPAGLGLIVLGGILQALGGAGSTPASAGSGSVEQGGTTTAGAGNTFDQETPEADRAKAQTGVTVVVQGNIFDNRETGLQIANIINEAFDTNGTIIRAMA